MNYKLINERNTEFTPIEQVLYNRGIKYEDIEHYCNTSILDILDPLLVANIREGAQMLIKHIKAMDKTYIQVDSDCDGYTSSALLINYLYSLFPHFVDTCVTWGLHKTKEHGIDLDFLPEDAKFIIVPDASSNEFELHKELKDKGIDILVIDHHEAEMVSPNACIINNQLDDYPNKTLSGVGMVYKFCCYIDSLLEKDNVNEFIDLVAVGLTGDMMDVRTFETRELIRRGFEKIRNPFIVGIIDRDLFHFSGEITQHKVAFYLVPLINAVTRVGTLEQKEILFESMLEHKAHILIPSTKRGEKGKTEQIVTQAVRMCTNVKKLQTTKRDDFFLQVVKQIEKENLLNHKILMVRLLNRVDKNLTGLIANEVANKYQRPTLILNAIIDEHGNVHCSGSGRNFANSPVENLKDLLASTNIIDFAEGHQNAFGFSILEENVEEFLEKTDEMLAEIDFTPSYFVDFIFKPAEHYDEVIFDLASFDNLWGQEVAEPYVVIEGLKVNKDNLVLMSRDKNPTLKITTPSGISIIKFKSSEEEFNKLYTETGYIEINVVGTCALNEWMGNYTAQVLVENYEIVGHNQYYF